MNSMQIIKQGLKFILLHTVLFGDKLFDIEQHIGAQLHDRVSIWSQRFDRFRLVAASISRIHYPVVVLYRVDCLYDGAYSPDVYVDVQIVDELRC